MISRRTPYSRLAALLKVGTLQVREFLKDVARVGRRGFKVEDVIEAVESGVRKPSEIAKRLKGAKNGASRKYESPKPSHREAGTSAKSGSNDNAERVLKNQLRNGEPLTRLSATKRL